MENVYKIPKDQLIAPDISILGPTLDASRFYIENSKLRELFAKVAASSMDKRLRNYSRAAFVEFIKQLSPLDIRLLYKIQGNVNVGVADTPMIVHGLNAIPLIDIEIVSPQQRTLFKENILPDTLSKELNCTYNELALSIDNLMRLGIVSKREGKLVKWRMYTVDHWFIDNKAIKGAHETISKEKNILEHNIFLRDNPQEKTEIIDGRKVKTTEVHAFMQDLDEDLEDANKKVVSKKDKIIKLTSLGADFVKVCL